MAFLRDLGYVPRWGKLVSRLEGQLMRSLILGAIAALAMTSASNAAIVSSLGGNTDPAFRLTLTQAGLFSGATQVATQAGGTVYVNDMPFADIPKGTVQSFLAAGPTSGNPATLTFINPVSYLSFLVGSPDDYNTLTLTTNQNTYSYTPVTLGFAQTNGNQAFSQYVQFTLSGGELLQSAQFSSTRDAFESANFSTTAVPGPIAGAGLIPLAGLGAAWFARRRKRVAA